MLASKPEAEPRWLSELSVSARPPWLPLPPGQGVGGCGTLRPHCCWQTGRAHREGGDLGPWAAPGPALRDCTAALVGEGPGASLGKPGKADEVPWRKTGFAGDSGGLWPSSPWDSTKATPGAALPHPLVTLQGAKVVSAPQIGKQAHRATQVAWLGAARSGGGGILSPSPPPGQGCPPTPRFSEEGRRPCRHSFCLAQP